MVVALHSRARRGLRVLFRTLSQRSDNHVRHLCECLSHRATICPDHVEDDFRIARCREAPANDVFVVDTVDDLDVLRLLRTADTRLHLGARENPLASL